MTLPESNREMEAGGRDPAGDICHVKPLRKGVVGMRLTNAQQRTRMKDKRCAAASSVSRESV